MTLRGRVCPEQTVGIAKLEYARRGGGGR